MKIYILMIFIITSMFSCNNIDKRIEINEDNVKIKSIEIIESLDTNQTVEIKDQIWMLYNLNVSVFKNGDTIFHAKTAAEWNEAGNSKKAAWCYYNNDINNEKYGKLYNWYAVNDKRGLAPNGWKIPKKCDWEELIKYYGGLNIIAKYLMSETGWEYENGNNKSGLDIKPAGGIFFNGIFEDFGYNAHFWCLDEYELNDEGHCFILSYYFSILTQFSKNYGLSVRCIRE